MTKMKTAMTLAALGLVATGTAGCGKASAQSTTEAPGIARGGVAWKDATGKVVPFLNSVDGEVSGRFFDAMGYIWSVSLPDGVVDVALTHQGSFSLRFKDAACSQPAYFIDFGGGSFQPRYTFKSVDAPQIVYAAHDNARYLRAVPATYGKAGNGSCVAVSQQDLDGQTWALAVEEATPPQPLSPPAFNFTMPLHPELVQ